MRNRDISKEILEGIKAIKKGKGRRFKVELPSDVKKTRELLRLSQSAFAALMGVSIKTLQEWEQGRRKPSGPASALLRIANKHPDALLS
ncbi:MAG: type II toxin-antitoxin system MqsA family antitoxin [Nitrospinae bacterium]|nr:type II toxin-antitoxin system MqsA family antitoxin [Nitrospinota bacterium]